MLIIYKSETITASKTTLNMSTVTSTTSSTSDNDANRVANSTANNEELLGKAYD